MPAPIMPNVNAPIGQDSVQVTDTKSGRPEQIVVNTIVTTGWQRFFTSLLLAAILPNMLVPYVGVSAPNGWVQDTTVGLPVLPAGYIWIKKV